jgi:hypothetical protein
MAFVVVRMASKHLPGSLFVPGTHENFDSENACKTALVFSF